MKSAIAFAIAGIALAAAGCNRTSYGQPEAAPGEATPVNPAPPPAPGAMSPTSPNTVNPINGSLAPPAPDVPGAPPQITPDENPPTPVK